MPQFDFYSFVTQAFWILFGLGFFYFFVVYHYIPKYAEALKTREKLKNHITTDSLSSNSVYDYFIKKIFDSLK